MTGGVRREVLLNAAKHADPSGGSDVWKIMLPFNLLDPERARRLMSLTRRKSCITQCPLKFAIQFSVLSTWQSSLKLLHLRDHASII